MRTNEVSAALEAIAPLHLAEGWDNVGWIVGAGDEVRRAILCIDYTRAVQDEADALECDLVIAYHPVIFEGLKRIAPDSLVGHALRRGRAIYCPHTALDVAPNGTNAVLADAVEMTTREPLRAIDPKRARNDAERKLGLGLVGSVATTTRRELVAKTKRALSLDHALVSGPLDAPCERVAVAAGAGEMIKDAVKARADVYVTGEVRHHDALWAAAAGMTVVCLRHSASERAVLSRVKDALAQTVPTLVVSISERDKDPFDPL
jgi:dinuclear metal center YbgI/SA1388 family protein